MKRGNPEGHIVLQILHYLRAIGCTAGKVKVKGSPKAGGGFLFDPYLMTGLPDIFCFDKNDIMYGIEVKAGKNNQTPNQVQFQQLFHLSPSRIYLIAYSLEDVMAVIK